MCMYSMTSNNDNYYFRSSSTTNIYKKYCVLCSYLFGRVHTTFIVKRTRLLHAFVFQFVFFAFALNYSTGLKAHKISFVLNDKYSHVYNDEMIFFFQVSIVFPLQFWY